MGRLSKIMEVGSCNHKGLHKGKGSQQLVLIRVMPSEKESTGHFWLEDGGRGHQPRNAGSL